MGIFSWMRDQPKDASALFISVMSKIMKQDVPSVLAVLYGFAKSKYYTKEFCP